MTVTFLFPGQGAQRPGMLHCLPDHPMVAATFEEASRILGRNVLELDEEKVLQSTVATQLAIYIAGVGGAQPGRRGRQPTRSPGYRWAPMPPRPPAERWISRTVSASFICAPR